MKRYGMAIKIRPGRLEEYKKLHLTVWPEVKRTIRECNIRNYSIYQKDELMFSYFEYIGADFAADMKKMAEDPVTQAWWAVCMPLQEPLPTRAEGEWWAEMAELFHQD